MQWWEEIDYKEALRRGEPPVREYPIYSAEIDDVLRGGLWMAPYYSHNWGLTRAEALVAIRRLAELGVMVLGADMWTPVNGRWTYSYDHASVDRRPGEPHAAAVARAAKEVAAYIRAYPAADNEVLFGLNPESGTPR